MLSFESVEHAMKAGYRLPSYNIHDDTISLRNLDGTLEVYDRDAMPDAEEIYINGQRVVAYK